MNSIPDILVESIMERECIFFIGAGMSIDAGLPSGKDLTNYLFTFLEKKTNYKKPDNFTLPRIAQDFEQLISRSKLEELIREKILDKISDADKTAYKRLAKLTPRPNIIITTNYDRLIEDSLKDYYVAICNDQSLSKYKLAHSNLYKIHGDINNMSEAIITEEDINNHRNPLLLKTMESLFQQRPIIFLGYSLEDNHFRNLYIKTRNSLGKHMPKSYAVTPGDNSKLRLDQIGVKHLKFTAREFLKKLESKIENYKHSSNIPGSHREDENNPFQIIAADSFNDESMLSINSSFVEPINYGIIKSSGNVILEGHRGSGKTTLLRYLSYPQASQRKNKSKEELNYIGFYIKLVPSLVKALQKQNLDLSEKEYRKYFITYFSLIFCESIIIDLMYAKRNQMIKFDSETDFVSTLIYLFFKNVKKLNKKNDLENLFYLIVQIRNSISIKLNLKFNLEPDFLERLIFLIKSHIKEWKNKNVYLLLDEYRNLDAFQQQIINSLISDRGNISYKIAVTKNSMIYSDSFGNYLHYLSDFNQINLGFSKFRSDYKNYLQNIANKRLEIAGFTTNINELLPALTESGLEHKYRDYSGFNKLTLLSSGSIRVFLTLCRDMFSYAKPYQSNKKELNSIPPNLQNTIIQMHSNRLYNNSIDILRHGFNNTNGEIESLKLKVFLDSLAKIYRKIVDSSQTFEERTVIGFNIENENELDPSVQIVLDNALSLNLIQITSRTHPITRITRKTYVFNRLLCPRYNLPIGSRWPITIHTKLLLELINSPESAIKNITKYYEKIKIKNKKIDDYY